MPPTISAITPEVREKLDERAVLESVRYMELTKFLRVKKLEKRSGDTVRFFDFDLGTNLASTPTADADILLPTGEAYSTNHYDALLEEYSQVWYGKKRDMDMRQEDARKELSKGVGKKMGQSQEKIIATKLLAGGSQVYANGAATLNAIVSKPLVADIVQIGQYFSENFVEKLSEYIDSDPGYATTPMPPSYVGLIPADAEADYRAMEGFIPSETYQTKGKMLSPEEIGAIGAIRLIKWDNYLLALAAGGDIGTTGLRSVGGTKVDVYTSIFLGKDAGGFCPFEVDPKKTDEEYRSQVIYVDGADKADPSGALVCFGWRANLGAAVFKEGARVICYRHGASALDVTVIPPA